MASMFYAIVFINSLAEYHSIISEQFRQGKLDLYSLDVNQ